MPLRRPGSELYKMKKTALIGLAASITAFIAASGYCIVQTLQILHVLKPPMDSILIYAFSLAIAPPFALAILAFHHITPLAKRLYTHAALLFAALYTGFASLVYPVQLAVAIPFTAAGKAAGIQVIVMSEHSFFWTLDAMAYIYMGISTLFAGLALEGVGRAKWLKRFLLLNGCIVPLIVLVYFYPHFSTGLLMAASPWAVTCPGAIALLAIYFRKLYSTAI